MNDPISRPPIGHEDPKVRAIFDLFKKRLDEICDGAIGKPNCSGMGHLEAIEKFFEGLKSHVRNVKDEDLFTLLNPGPLDAYAIKNPSSTTRTILIEREFAEKALALGGLP